MNISKFARLRVVKANRGRKHGLRTFLPRH